MDIHGPWLDRARKILAEHAIMTVQLLDNIQNNRDPTSTHRLWFRNATPGLENPNEFLKNSNHSAGFRPVLQENVWVVAAAEWGPRDQMLKKNGEVQSTVLQQLHVNPDVNWTHPLPLPLSWLPRKRPVPVEPQARALNVRGGNNVNQSKRGRGGTNIRGRGTGNKR